MKEIFTFICQMLSFNHLGLLINGPIIRSSVTELEAVFVIDMPSPERVKHFNAYTEYSKQLKSVCGGVHLTQWIDGSFTTRKAVPGDIDLVTFIDYQTLISVGDEIKRFIYPQSEDHFKVDAYVISTYPPENRKFFLYQSDIAYWMNQFTKTKRNRIGKKQDKGFLEIVY